MTDVNTQPELVPPAAGGLPGAAVPGAPAPAPAPAPGPAAAASGWRRPAARRGQPAVIQAARSSIDRHEPTNAHGEIDGATAPAISPCFFWQRQPI